MKPIKVKSEELTYHKNRMKFSETVCTSLHNVLMSTRFVFTVQFTAVFGSGTFGANLARMFQRSFD
jgi:hypothetical protein